MDLTSYFTADMIATELLGSAWGTMLPILAGIAALFSIKQYFCSLFDCATAWHLNIALLELVA